MVKFIPHGKSLKNMQFNNIQEMKIFIVTSWNSIWNGPKTVFDIEDIVIGQKVPGFENAKYVCVKRMGEENWVQMYGKPQAIGVYLE